MKKLNLFKRSIIICLLVFGLSSICIAVTTEKGRDILSQLKEDGRTDDEIRQAMTDLGYDANEYLGEQTEQTLKVITSNDDEDLDTNTENTNTQTSNNKSTGKTSKLGREILNKYREEGRTDEEIKQALEELGLDTSGYFPENKTNQNNTTTKPGLQTYISRSCKPYTIEYVQSINAYTSPDLRKKEYFVNVEYFKRYVDSKNAQSAECYRDSGRISTQYEDYSTRTDQYIAPNGKVYLIKEQNGSYTSEQLNSPKYFKTVYELKKYIRERNPLVSMGVPGLKEDFTKDSNNTNSAAIQKFNDIYRQIGNLNYPRYEDKEGRDTEIGTSSVDSIDEHKKNIVILKYNGPKLKRYFLQLDEISGKFYYDNENNKISEITEKDVINNVFPIFEKNLEEAENYIKNNKIETNNNGSGEDEDTISELRKVLFSD